MKDTNGKTLTREHYKLLLDLGIEIFMYDLAVYDENVPKTQYGFTIWGSLNENVDFDELLTLLRLIKTARESDSEAVKELYGQLLTMLFLTEKSK